MAVKVNLRHLSDTEYENTFTKLLRYLQNRFEHLPKRHLRFLGKPYNDLLCDEYEVIMEITEEYYKGHRYGIARYRQCVKALEIFEEIISYTYMFWNIAYEKNGIKHVKQNSREFWANYINNEIILINGIMKKCNGYNGNEKLPKAYSYLNSSARKAIFLSNLMDITRTVYKYASHSSKNYRDIQIESLLKFSRHAFYFAITGNIIPTNSKEYKIRKSNLSNAIDNLYKMNRPIKELAFNHVFSDNDLEKLSSLVTDTIKVITTIQKNDSERYKELIQ